MTEPKEDKSDFATTIKRNAWDTREYNGYWRKAVLESVVLDAFATHQQRQQTQLQQLRQKLLDTIKEHEPYQPDYESHRAGKLDFAKELLAFLKQNAVEVGQK